MDQTFSINFSSCSIKVQEKSLKMPRFPTRSFQLGELSKHMYDFEFVLRDKSHLIMIS